MSLVYVHGPFAKQAGKARFAGTALSLDKQARTFPAAKRASEGFRRKTPDRVPVVSNRKNDVDLSHFDCWELLIVPSSGYRVSVYPGIKNSFVVIEEAHNQEMTKRYSLLSARLVRDIL